MKDDIFDQTLKGLDIMDDALKGGQETIKENMPGSMNVSLGSIGIGRQPRITKAGLSTPYKRQ